MESLNHEDPLTDEEDRNEEAVAFTGNEHHTDVKHKRFFGKKRGRRNLILVVAHIALILIVVILIVYFTAIHKTDSSDEQGKHIPIYILSYTGLYYCNIHIVIYRTIMF